MLDARIGRLLHLQHDPRSSLTLFWDVFVESVTPFFAAKNKQKFNQNNVNAVRTSTYLYLPVSLMVKEVIRRLPLLRRKYL